MSCEPRPSKFDGHQVKGIYHFIFLALNTKLQYLEFAAKEGFFEDLGETKKALKFLKEIPLSCKKAHRGIQGNIKHYCNYIEEIGTNYSQQFEVCR